MNTNKLALLVSNSKRPKSKIAESIGITRMTLDNAIRGGDIRISILEAIAKEFGVPVGYFFDENPATNSTVSTSGDNSPAVGIGNITHGADQAEISLLQEKINSLEALLTEKERLIRVYEKMMEIPR